MGIPNNLKNENGGVRTDVVIKFILVFFIALLSFSVGTFVGKQFSDSQHRLAALETDYQKSESQIRETASIPPGQMDVAPEKALTDEDISKMAEDFVAQDDAAAADRQPSNDKDETAPTTNVEQKPDPKDTKIETVVEKVAEGKAPLAAQPIEKPIKKPVLPTTVAATTIGKYTVQISAQPSEELAKEQVEKLKGQGYGAFYVEANKDGKSWYRVNIGLFTNAKEAVNYSKTIQDKFKGAFVKPIVQ